MDNGLKTTESTLSFTPSQRERELGNELRERCVTYCTDALQIGRVLTEAKKDVPHGHWREWLAFYSGCSVRYAEMLMAAWTRYGQNPALTGVSKTNMFKMLSLPEGTEEKFLAENDVSAMTAKEVEAAVKRARAEMNDQLEAERKARQEAERLAQEALNRPPELPDEVAEQLREQQSTIEQLREMAGDAVTESTRLQREKARMEQEMKDQAALLEETQEECTRAQEALLNAQSALARGDADRMPEDTLTPEALAAAVNSFIGAVCRMPHMKAAFARMDGDTKTEYAEMLDTVADWLKGAREALRTASAEGSVY